MLTQPENLAVLIDLPGAGLTPCTTSASGRSSLWTSRVRKTTAPALETLAVSTLSLNTQTQPEYSSSNRP
jgi:hypothetical protein